MSPARAGRAASPRASWRAPAWLYGGDGLRRGSRAGRPHGRNPVCRRGRAVSCFRKMMSGRSGKFSGNGETNSANAGEWRGRAAREFSRNLPGMRWPGRRLYADVLGMGARAPRPAGCHRRPGAHSRGSRLWGVCLGLPFLAIAPCFFALGWLSFREMRPECGGQCTLWRSLLVSALSLVAVASLPLALAAFIFSDVIISPVCGGRNISRPSCAPALRRRCMCCGTHPGRRNFRGGSGRAILPLSCEVEIRFGNARRTDGRTPRIGTRGAHTRRWDSACRD